MLKKIAILFFPIFLYSKSIEFLDTKILGNPTIDGLKFTEISDIAYDKKRDIFYAVSDRGRIFELKIDIKDNKIENVTYLLAKELRAKRDKKLSKKYKDSESLALKGNNILISFEGKSRIVKYDKNFHYKKRLKLPRDLKYFVKRDHSKDGFEALTYDKKYGFITARERPFWNQRPKGYHALFGKNGEICKFKVDKRVKSLTELEMLDDGNLLALFRDFSFKKLSFDISLKIIDLKSIKNGECEVRSLVYLNSMKDRYVDNYEGLTHYKDDLYLMVSDDNNNIFQRTILRLFKIKDDK